MQSHACIHIARAYIPLIQVFSVRSHSPPQIVNLEARHRANADEMERAYQEREERRANGEFSSRSTSSDGGGGGGDSDDGDRATETPGERISRMRGDDGGD
jgi:hypothetical protein